MLSHDFKLTISSVYYVSITFSYFKSLAMILAILLLLYYYIMFSYLAKYFNIWFLYNKPQAIYTVCLLHLAIS